MLQWRWRNWSWLNFCSWWQLPPYCTQEWARFLLSWNWIIKWGAGRTLCRVDSGFNSLQSLNWGEKNIFPLPHEHRQDEGGVLAAARPPPPPLSLLVVLWKFTSSPGHYTQVPKELQFPECLMSGMSNSAKRKISQLDGKKKCAPVQAPHCIT